MPEFRPNWHHNLLATKCDELLEGTIDRLIVCLPPRHTKSEIFSRRLPALALGRFPHWSVIAASYGADLASRMNRDVQRVIDSEQYQDLFPDTKLSVGRSVSGMGYSRNSDLFEVVGAKGSYRSAGVGGGITGMGFDFGIIDDPFKDREQADSPVYRQAVWDWFTSTFYTRQQKNARILLVMTRWNPDDLVGRIIKQMQDNPTSDKWEIVSLPAIAKEERPNYDTRKPGEALWPSEFSLDFLEKLKVQSPYDWAGLYQQEPRSQGSAEFPDSYFDDIWFDRWPSDIVYRVMALDPSKGKQSRKGDYAATVAIGIARDGKLYVDANFDKANVDIMLDGAIEFSSRFAIETSGPVDAFGVEANQFQELLADILTDKTSRGRVALPVYKINNNVNKEIRIRRLTPYLSTGQVKIRNTPGGRLLVDQLKEFPTGEHDDGPDAFEMALRLGQEVHGDQFSNETIAGSILSGV
jgi:predicted phage terminase large subunit-like protein